MWGPKRTASALLLLFSIFAVAPSVRAAGGNQSRSSRSYKLDDELTNRAVNGDSNAVTRVIVRLQPGATLPPQFKKFAIGRHLRLLNGDVLDVPNGVLKQLAAHPSIFRVHYDRPVQAHNYRTSLTSGARQVRQMLGLNGAGIGVAVIDSGVASWHDDLTPGAGDTTVYPYGNQRVSAFVDFVNGRTQPYDDFGHGSHVAGTILGNGYDSYGRQAGMAPAASLVSLKVLDANGNGTISNIIAALDWIVANHQQYNIRVVNMSIGAGVYESYWTDPLTLAAKNVVDAGIVVVAAAGNFGKNPTTGLPQYGGITAPGNAPWVLTVGASSTQGTLRRSDDVMASFSSRGPTAIDYSAKPDIVASGMGTTSLAAPGSTMYTSLAQYLQPGAFSTPNMPYLALSGTSMAAPVVSGTVALMLQENPSLTPNAVKAILEYTAQIYPGYDSLTEGAGFLNTVGAVRLARFYATAVPGETMPSESMWGRQIIWGNELLGGGFIRPSGSAWRVDTVWGGTQAANGDNIVWGSACTDAGCDNIVWGSAGGDNIVWGSAGADNIVWGSSTLDNIVWGSSLAANIVWGSSLADNIVWGSNGADNIVWGSNGGDNIVWGSSLSGDNIVWGSSLSGDNIVWGSATGDNIVWGSSWGGAVLWTNPITGFSWSGAGSALFDRLTDASIFGFTSFSVQTTTTTSTTSTTTITSGTTLTTSSTISSTTTSSSIL